MKTISVFNSIGLKINLLLCFTLSFIQLPAQVANIAIPKRTNPRVDSTISFLSPTSPYKLRIAFHHPVLDTVFDRSYKDSTCASGKFAFNLSHLASNLNIQYLNDSVWYLYGTRTEYAYYPYIFRTSNAGLSWHTIMQSTIEKHDRSIDYKYMGRNMFHMFDLLNGIWIIELHKNTMEYRITKDGGVTWIKKWLRIKNLSKLQINSKLIKVIYTSDNSVQISLHGYLEENGKWTKTSIIPVYSSNNFGHKFRRIN